MSTIAHTRGKVNLERNGAGSNTQWKLSVAGQVSGASFQVMIINDPEVLQDLKAIIGQVEQAAKVLGMEVAD